MVLYIKFHLTLTLGSSLGLWNENAATLRLLKQEEEENKDTRRRSRKRTINTDKQRKAEKEST